MTCVSMIFSEILGRFQFSESCDEVCSLHDHLEGKQRNMLVGQ